MVDRRVREPPRDEWSEVSRGFEGFDPSYDPKPPAGDAVAREVESWAGPPGEAHPYRGSEGHRYTFGPPPPYYQAPPPYAYPYGYPYPPKPANPALAVVGGMLTLVAGALTLIWVALTLTQDELIFIFPFDACIALQVVFGIIAVLGGLAAIMKRFFPLAITGAVLAMFSGGFLGISFMLGLIGLIFIAISHGAFIPMTSPMSTYRY